MRRPSFETQDEKKMYELGRQHAMEELMQSWYADLKERGAFPDENIEAFSTWGQEVLIPIINKYRSQDDLFDLLMNS